MLNPAQQRGVDASGHCLITACPGSGKTKTLSLRAARLLQNPNVKVAAVTFTSDAADELTHRIRAEVPGAENRIISGTFHKLAKDQLDRIGKRVRLASEMQSVDFIRRAAKRYLPDEDLDAVVSYVQGTKSRLTPVPGGSDAHTAVFNAYQATLKQRGLHDFQDLLLLTVTYMRNNQMPPLEVQHLLVDEVQDADDMQWAWVLEHARAGVEITAVGDDDQSIYAWRWACGYAGMQQFKDRVQASHVPLEMSYRCAPEILRHAGLLIAHNLDRVDKLLSTANMTPGKVVAESCGSRAAEADTVIRHIMTSASPDTWAVLARSNSQLDTIEHDLMSCEPPHRAKRLGGKSYWERKGPALMLGMLESLTSGMIGGAESLLEAAGIPHDLIESYITRVDGHRRGGLTRFLDMPIEVEDEHTGAIAEFQGLARDWLAGVAGTEAQLGVAVTGVQLWIDGRVPKKITQVPVKPCTKALTNLKGPLALRIRFVREKRKNDAKAVTLATLHASKGMEFDRVWIVGCEDGSIPHANGELEEERRLFYVGMTRARQELRLSYIGDARNTVSRFLAEAKIPTDAR